MVVRSTRVAPSVAFIDAQLSERNKHSGALFAHHASALARASRQMAERFAQGGRLLALGRRQYATDAQHVQVEFVHPVLVGKPALPALDVSLSPGDWLRALLGPEDMVMAFGPPEGDPHLAAMLAQAAEQGAQTFALPGVGAAFSIEPSTMDPFIHQELVEVLYHTLWETVHVFLEHRGLDHDAGPAAFLYPFLGRESQEPDTLLTEIATSILSKAADTEQLRLRLSEEQGEAIARATQAMHERVCGGGTLILFGNGGSATDANDWALDCVAPLKGHSPVRAISLAMDSATISALANDIGPDELFLRQMIAHARPGDVAIAISTSGGSHNVIAALDEARKRGLLTVALLGNDGGEIVRRGIAQHPIVVRCDYIPRIQEVHASIYHVMLDLLDAMRRGELPAHAGAPA